MKNVWLFGYGSLIWNPDIPYLDWKPATLSGFVRKFWQGSHDHRGTPENPGRVVTLIPCEKGYCDGIAYLVSLSTVKSVFEKLDHREKNGYSKTKVFLNFTDKTNEEAITYIAKSINPAFWGPLLTHQLLNKSQFHPGQAATIVHISLNLPTPLGNTTLSTSTYLS